MTSLRRFLRRHETSDGIPSGDGGAGPSGQDDIDAVVFCGGGTRCFWQAGFWQAAQTALPRPTVVAAVSGGAALAAVLFAGGWPRFFPKFLELTSGCESNVQLGNLLRRRPMFPHPRISRDSILHAVTLRELERLCTGPDFRIVVTHPPRRLGAGLGALVAIAVQEIELRLTKRLHPRWVGGLGFHTRTIRARDCGTPEELVHAIFQSSAVPPVFPVTHRNGHPALDGGLVENVPLSAVAECRRPLVLLSRHRRTLPRGGRELYACPSEPVPVATSDFSSPDKVIETYELGRSDGEVFLQQRQTGTPA